MKFDNSQRLRARAHQLIPGGSHTYAKGDDQFPELSPGFIARGQGCHAWDVDGNEFIEYGMGLRAVTLGHAFEPVVRAACEQMKLGVNFTRPAPIEVECAESFLGVVEGAEQVKFAKDGSTVVTAAVKLARAHTGRDMVAICGDHPFFSYNDWFIGTTGIPGGILPQSVALTLKFRYNDIASVERLFVEYPGRIACVLLEAARTDEPRDGFLEKLQALCRREGALLVFDEMITGFRWHLGGAQKVYGVTPDLSTFGKALGNGFAISALAGRREIMELGGLHHPRERVFLLSTTHGAETHALAAAIEVIRVYKTQPVVETLYRQGERLRAGIEKVTAELGLASHFPLSGRPCNLLYGTLDQDLKSSQPFRTLFLQETIRRGVIAPSFVVSYAHTDRDIDRTIEAVGEALLVYRKALSEGVEKYLVGPSVKTVYRKFN
jgi:glutamate-1-semialdehyde 2,1-aminomutase